MVHVWRPDLQQLVLSARRDVESGGELNTSYAGAVARGSTSERREHLQREFGFRCLCERCVRGDVHAPLVVD